MTKKVSDTRYVSDTLLTCHDSITLNNMLPVPWRSIPLQSDRQVLPANHWSLTFLSRLPLTLTAQEIPSMHRFLPSHESLTVTCRYFESSDPDNPLKSLHRNLSGDTRSVQNVDDVPPPAFLHGTLPHRVWKKPGRCLRQSHIV